MVQIKQEEEVLDLFQIIFSITIFRLTFLIFFIKFSCYNFSSDLNPVSEDPVGEKESVEEINGEEPEVCQSLQENMIMGPSFVSSPQPHLQQSLGCGVADLRNFTVVQGSREPDVNVIFEERGVALDKLRDQVGGDAGHHHPQPVTHQVDVVHALGDVRDPGSLLLLGRSHQVERGLLAGLDGVNLDLEVEAVVLGLPRPAATAQVAQAAGAAQARAKRGL